MGVAPSIAAKVIAADNAHDMVVKGRSKSCGRKKACL